MSDQTHYYQHSSTRGFDPITFAGGLILLLFLGIVGYNVVQGNRSEAIAPNNIANEVVAQIEPQLENDLVALATITPTPPPTETKSPTLTPTQTNTPIPTATATATHTPIPTATKLPTEAPTAEPLTQTSINSAPKPTATPLLPTPTANQSPIRVPILMYHYASDPPPGSDRIRTDLSVGPAAFREQLQWFSDNGFTTITLYDLSLALAGQQQLPPNSVVLTFDDGHRDQYTYAFPLLQEYGMVATFFIITDLPDEWNDLYMTWPMIEEMAAAGMDMEVHTRSHPDLANKTWEYVYDELGPSLITLWEHTGRRPRFVSYPGGSYDDIVLDVVDHLDMWGAVTTEWGLQHEWENRYTLERIRIRNSTRLHTFRSYIYWEP